MKRRYIASLAVIAGLALAGCGNGVKATQSIPGSSGVSGTPTTQVDPTVSTQMSASEAVDMIVQAMPGLPGLVQTAIDQDGSNVDQARAEFKTGYDLMRQQTTPEIQARMPDSDAMFDALLNRVGR